MPGDIIVVWSYEKNVVRHYLLNILRQVVDWVLINTLNSNIFSEKALVSMILTK